MEINEQALIKTRPALVFSSKPGLSLREVADIVCRQRTVLGFWIILIFSGFVTYLLLTPNRYKSQMMFLLVNQRPVPSISQGDTQAGGLGSEVTDSQMATEMQLMLSRETVKRVVESAGLVPSGDAPYEVRLARAEQRFSKSFAVTPDGKSSLITVSFVGTSPQQTTNVLGTFASTYLSREYQIHKAGGSYEFFKSQAVHFENEWREAQSRLTAFEQRANVVVLDEQKDLGIRKLNDLGASLNEAESATSEAVHKKLALEGQLLGLAARIVTVQRLLPPQYTVEHLNTEIVDLKNKKTELLMKFLPDSRMVQEVEQQIAQTQSALEQTSTLHAKEEATDVNPLRQSIEAQIFQQEGVISGLTARASSVMDQVGQARRTVEQLGRRTEEYQQLVSQVKESEAKYLLYSRQSEQSRISEEMERQRVANVVVADPPGNPVAPEPKLSLNVGFGFLLCVAGIIAATFMKGLRRNQIFTPWELEGVAGVPVLGTVPDISPLVSLFGPKQ